MHVKDLIQQNDQAGIRPSKTYQALANAVGGPANLTFTEKDVRNYISRHLRISGDETDPKELLKHFSRMKELNPNFFFEIDMDENHSIRNVFWADAWCRAAWEYFGDVVTVDTTYKTNRYEIIIFLLDLIRLFSMKGICSFHLHYMFLYFHCLGMTCHLGLS
ncbi:hypothetical protein Ahy_B09g095774 isoform E [Arachis hypogaea]|uniref:Uncharacterized protein n=1 Tax=Arachis hypogaea TaxID=3818 RepID=A0A444XGR9_ARAHY|nr:hypothetical protein Ahy_B09g095774 isoform E [Arachis hypogaea]